MTASTDDLNQLWEAERELALLDADDLPRGEPGTATPIGKSLDTMSVAEFCGQDLPPIDWLVPRFLSRGGFTVPYGAPKAGKTTIVYHLIAALGCGGNFLGHSVPRERVLLLDLEQPRRVSQRALHRAGVPMADDRVIIYRGALPSLADVLATVEVQQVSVVVVDSLSRWLQLENENDNAEWTRRLDPVLRAFQALDISLIGIHHDRKSEGSSGRNLRGGSALLAMCDTAIEVRRLSQENDADTRRQLNFTSREEPQPSLIIRLDQRTNRYVEEGTPTAAWEREILEVLGTLAEPATSEELAPKLHGDERRVRERLNAMVSGGRIARTGEGKKGDPYKYGAFTHSGDAGTPEFAANAGMSM